MEEGSEKLKVGLRVRPILQSDQVKENSVILDEEGKITVTDGDHIYSTVYDSVFSSQSSQAEVFEFVKKGIEDTAKGFNCTIFAYGQTGSGKTYTMFGEDWETNNPAPQTYFLTPRRPPKPKNSGPRTFENPKKFGIVPNAIFKLFEVNRKSSLTFYCSFLQIYNEKLYDLLQDPVRAKPLNIREDKTTGIFVENLAEYIVETAQDCCYLLKQGDRNRVVRQTKFNHHSSRSHTIFQLLLESDKANKRGGLVRAKLNLCDLAGSESYDKKGHMAKDHIVEMNNINKSLSELGIVISALAKNKGDHVPYRNSKLTRLLQDSLSRNTRTILIATVAPTREFVEETINTLKFADRAKLVTMKVSKNEISATNNELVSKLKSEISYLKNLLNLKKGGGMSQIHQKMQQLEYENQKLKELTKEISVAEVENLKKENKNLRLELQNLKEQNETKDSSFFITETESQNSVPKHEYEPKEDTPSFQTKPTLQQWKQQNYENAMSNLKSKIVSEGRCPVCTLKPPCKHYQDTEELPKLPPIAKQSESRRETPIARFLERTAKSEPRPEPKPPLNKSLETPNRKMTVRYRNKNSFLEEAGGFREMKEREEKRKAIRDAENRLAKLAKIEQFKEEKLKKELEKLEEEKRKEEEELAKKRAAEAKRLKHVERQKQKLQQHRELRRKEQEELLAKQEKKKKPKKQRRKTIDLKNAKNTEEELLKSNVNQQDVLDMGV